MLQLAYPEVAARSCEECEKYWYDQDGNCPTRKGLKLVRPEGSKTPCHACPKIPLEKRRHGATKDLAVELSDENWDCWEHYQEGEATGWKEMKIDALVRRHARMFKQIYKKFEDARGDGMLRLLAMTQRSLNKRK